MIKEYREGNIVKKIKVPSDDIWQIIDDIKINGQVHLKPHMSDNLEVTIVAINEVEEVRITIQDWSAERFRFLFEFHGDDIDYYYRVLNNYMGTERELKNEDEKINSIINILKSKYTDNEIRSHIQSLYDRGIYKEPFDPKILLKGCELKGLKDALKDGQYFFLNKLQNYLEDNPNLNEVDISSIPNLINKPKSN